MATRIQQLREEQHMTQVRLSIELGVSQETVSAYEKGKHYPSVSTLIQLSQLFHVSCDYILGLSDCRYPDSPFYLSSEEQKLLSNYQQLSEIQQGKLLAYLDGLTDCD